MIALATPEPSTIAAMVMMATMTGLLVVARQIPNAPVRKKT